MELCISVAPKGMLAKELNQKHKFLALATDKPYTRMGRAWSLPSLDSLAENLRSFL